MPDLSNVSDYIPETQPVPIVRSVTQEEAIAQGFYTVTQEELNLQLPQNITSISEIQISDLQKKIDELKSLIEILINKS